MIRLHQGTVWIMRGADNQGLRTTVRTDRPLQEGPVAGLAVAWIKDPKVRNVPICSVSKAEEIDEKCCINHILWLLSKDLHRWLMRHLLTR